MIRLILTLTVIYYLIQAGLILPLFLLAMAYGLFCKDKPQPLTDPTREPDTLWTNRNKLEDY
jgi:hypothetical protein